MENETIEKPVENVYTDPVTGKFKKGNPGGPGVPKGTRWLTTKLEIALNKILEGNEEAEDIEVVKALIRKAKLGDVKAIELIFDRVEGKPKQDLGLTGEINIRVLQQDDGSVVIQTASESEPDHSVESEIQGDSLRTEIREDDAGSQSSPPTSAQDK